MKQKTIDPAQACVSDWFFPVRTTNSLIGRNLFIEIACNKLIEYEIEANVSILLNS